MDIICLCLLLDDLKTLFINITEGSFLPRGQPPPAESYIWRIIFSPAFNLVQSLLEYLRIKLGVGVTNYRVGSLLITVTCSSLQILEGLWEDYSSGHLNKVIEQTLVTPDVLEKLGLSELKLKTTISEEEYKKCKEFFLSKHQVRGVYNFICWMQNYANPKKVSKSSHLKFGGHLFNTFQTSTVTIHFGTKQPTLGSVLLNSTENEILLEDCPLSIQPYDH